MADVWTSLGVIVGVAAAALTGWHRLDAIVAIAVALQVIRAGRRLLRRSMLGLLDTSLPEEIAGERSPTILERHGRDGRAVPRAPDPAGRRAAIHLVSHSGAGRLDGAARARSAGGDRGAGPGGGAQQRRGHPSRADRGSGVVGGHPTRAAAAGHRLRSVAPPAATPPVPSSAPRPAARTARSPSRAPRPPVGPARRCRAPGRGCSTAAGPAAPIPLLLIQSPTCGTSSGRTTISSRSPRRGSVRTIRPTCPTSPNSFTAQAPSLGKDEPRLLAADRIRPAHDVAAAEVRQPVHRVQLHLAHRRQLERASRLHVEERMGRPDPGERSSSRVPQPVAEPHHRVHADRA